MAIIEIRGYNSNGGQNTLGTKFVLQSKKKNLLVLLEQLSSTGRTFLKSSRWAKTQADKLTKTVWCKLNSS